MGTASVPPDVEIDQEELLTALWRHKLTGRFLGRLRSEQPPWADADLSAAVAAQGEEINAVWERRLDQIRGIDQLQSHAPAIFLKGITAYALTGDPALRRRSNDIDVIVADSDALIESLLDDGYAFNDDHCRNHEYASLEKHGTKLDIHSHFPALMPATPLSTERSRPSEHPDTWPGFQAFVETPIGYADLEPHTVVGRDRAQGLHVVNVTVAALLTVTHSYREFADEPMPVPYATVRLGDIAELAGYIRDPDFDRALFDLLVKRHQAEASVRFAGYLLHRWCGVSDLLSAGDEATVFPNDLYLDGFVIAYRAGAELDDLLVRDRATTMGALVDWTGGDPVRPADDPGDGYSTGAAVPGKTLGRRLLQGEGVAATLRFGWDDSCLTVEVDYHGPPRDQEMLFLNTGDILHELSFDAETQTWDAVWQRNAPLGQEWRAPLDVDFVVESQARRARVRFDWKRALEHSPQEDLAVMLGLRVKGQGSDADAVLLPLHLVPGSE